MYFLSSRGGADGLWRVQNGNAAEIWKGADGALFEPPAVSPLGDWIAVMLPKQNGLRLTLVSADGAVHRDVVARVAARGTPAWSPDGKRIVFGRDDTQGAGLVAIELESGALTQLADGKAYDPVWSPTSDLIVYTAEQEGGTFLRAMRSDGRPVELPAIEAIPNPAVRARRRLALTRFLPDGGGLVFTRGAPGRQDFWLLDFTTNKVRMIARLSHAASSTTFDITPDGRHIVFDRVEEHSNLVLIDRDR